jgi:hypothetical protein
MLFFVVYIHMCETCTSPHKSSYMFVYVSYNYHVCRYMRSHINVICVTPTSECMLACVHSHVVHICPYVLQIWWIHVTICEIFQLNISHIWHKCCFICNMCVRLCGSYTRQYIFRHIYEQSLICQNNVYVTYMRVPYGIFVHVEVSEIWNLNSYWILSYFFEPDNCPFILQPSKYIPSLTVI